MQTTPILTVDGTGTLNAFSYGAGSSWSGPQLLGSPVFPPGAETAGQAIGPSTFAALAVDICGVLNGFFFDEAAQSWSGPILIGDANLVPGAAIAIVTADQRQFWALTIDRSGLLNIFVLDTAGGQMWTTAAILGDGDLVPGTRLTIAGDATPALSVLTVDRQGTLQIYSLDTASPAAWSGPVRMMGARLVAGAWIGA